MLGRTVSTDPRTTLRSVLLNPTSERFVTALAPVLVASVDAIALPALQHELSAAGVPNRLGWLVENILAAMQRSSHDRTAPEEQDFRRADLLLSRFLVHVEPSDKSLLDPFDQGVRSDKSLQRLWSEASDISKRWRTASRLTVADFVLSLEDALTHRR